MRALASILLALVCLLALAAGANGGQTHIYQLTFNEAGLGGHQRRVLSRHDIYPEAASISLDGKQFAYVPFFYDGARSNDLRVAEVRSSRDRSIFRAHSWIDEVAWAPNGRKIALVVGSNQPLPGDGIWLVQADGTGPRRIADGGSELAWSPDSKRLAIVRSSISVLSVDTGAVLQVAAGSRPQWSPDGRFLLFEVWAGRFAPKIRIVSADGGEARTVARGSRASWSPDGKRIAFQLSTQKESTLWVVSSRGGRPRLLAHDAYGAAWSPGSRWIAFTRDLGFANPCDPDFREGLYVVAAKAGRPRLLATESRIITPLTWSRGGRRVLYEAERCFTD